MTAASTLAFDSRHHGGSGISRCCFKPRLFQIRSKKRTPSLFCLLREIVCARFGSYAHLEAGSKTVSKLVQSYILTSAEKWCAIKSLVEIHSAINISHDCTWYSFSCNHRGYYSVCLHTMQTHAHANSANKLVKATDNSCQD